MPFPFLIGSYQGLRLQSGLNRPLETHTLSVLQFIGIFVRFRGLRNAGEIPFADVALGDGPNSRTTAPEWLEVRAIVIEGSFHHRH